ncbi:hypothetical protein R3W88_018777 [Solanum pinnatisectum]|uniref:RING-type domain-containing protein n=1 Tax=Solanum pinnatisectum TaxID=50273 RepID=A0AAV9KHE3_9SOLN|nr:hypothetical protein R3W88_018777 [Solanum pinnatisectum]
MVGSPLGWECKTDGSIHSEVVDKQLEGPLLTPVSSVGRYPVLSSKKDAQILKKNSSHCLNTKVLSGKESESIRKLRIRAETRNRSSFSSHTISSSRKIRTKKEKVQVQQIKRISAPPPVPGRALAGKTRLPTFIRQSKSSTSTEEPSRISETYLGYEEPIHHIAWEGSDENFHSSGVTCPICENDLCDMPDEYADAYAYTDEYNDDVEPSVLPSVAILSCGHAFHAVCLEGITPEENSSDPPCLFCLSCMS